MQTLNVTIVQADLHWQDGAKNRAMFADLIAAQSDATDLIVLPEMFATGFSMDTATCAETMDGESIRWMRQLATQSSAAICGSLIIADGADFYNRFFCIRADGEQTTYDKRHLFRLANEQAHYSQGNDKVVFTINGFRICPMICYDLRFPVWSRNRNDYDVLVYVANWPSRRHHAWETLLRARAIENMSYAIGVNRVGTDGNDLPYAGGSAIVDFLGHDLADLGSETGLATAILKLDDLNKFRERFAFHKDADHFTIAP